MLILGKFDTKNKNNKIFKKICYKKLYDILLTLILLKLQDLSDIEEKSIPPPPPPPPGSTYNLDLLRKCQIRLN